MCTVYRLCRKSRKYKLEVMPISYISITKIFCKFKIVDIISYNFHWSQPIPLQLSCLLNRPPRSSPSQMRVKMRPYQGTTLANNPLQSPYSWGSTSDCVCEFKVIIHNVVYRYVQLKVPVFSGSQHRDKQSLCSHKIYFTSPPLPILCSRMVGLQLWDDLSLCCMAWKEPSPLRCRC